MSSFIDAMQTYSISVLPLSASCIGPWDWIIVVYPWRLHLAILTLRDNLWKSWSGFFQPHVPSLLIVLLYLLRGFSPSWDRLLTLSLFWVHSGACIVQPVGDSFNLVSVTSYPVLRSVHTHLPWYFSPLCYLTLTVSFRVGPATAPSLRGHSRDTLCCLRDHSIFSQPCSDSWN